MDRTVLRLMSMEKKRPQLNLDELSRVRWLLGGTLALFSVWTVFYLDVEAWTLLILNTVGIIAVLVRPELPAKLPRAFHYAAFPVIVTIFLTDLWLSGEGEILPPMIRLDLMLILYRGISYRERRDDLQLIVLGLFLVVVAGVLTVSIAFAAQIIAFTGCALLLLLVITLVDGIEAKDPAPKVPLFTWGGVAVKPTWAERTGWSRLWPRLRTVIDWRIAVLGVILFAGVVTISGLLFLAIPRFQLENSLFLERFISKKSKTGFSDNIKFGDVTDIISDDSVALSIDVTDPRQVPTPLYLRMVVLDEYRDGGFKLSTELRRDSRMLREVNRTRIQGPELPSRGEPVYWTFYLESGISRYLPLPGSYSLLSFRETQNVAASAELRTVALHNEPVSMLAYRLEGVNSSPVLRDSDFAARLRLLRNSSDRSSSTAQRRMQLGLAFSEADSAVLQRLVGEIQHGATPAASASANANSGSVESATAKMTPQEFARLACAFLQQQHSYSMQSSLPAGKGDPLVRWLDTKGPGHCELFAGAFVALARTAGYPARVVSGFRTGTWNAFSDSLSVRNSEAHAWGEIWDESASSWVRVDPTPGATAVATAEEQAVALSRARDLDRSWKARWNSLRIFWYRRIVNFDSRSQLDTFQAVKKSTEESGVQVRDALENIVKWMKAWLTSPWTLRRSILALTLLVGMGGTAWCVRMFLCDWRWRFQQRRTATKHDPVRAEAGKWLVRFQQREAHDAASEEVRLELKRLRYGAPTSWPEPATIFQNARRVTKKPRRKNSERPS